MSTLGIIKPKLSEDEMENSREHSIPVWKDNKGWVKDPSLERKLLGVRESYADKDSDSHFYCIVDGAIPIVGKIFPKVYSVYVKADGTVEAADEPSLPADYARHFSKSENPLKIAKYRRIQNDN